MLPIMLDLARGPVVLYGSGPAAVRRLRLLEAAGARDLKVYPGASPDAELVEAAGARITGSVPDDDVIASALVMFVAGLPDREAERVATVARAAGVLVNVEDRTAWCDFHTPSLVRRGDLVIAVSTGGKSPGLARRIRERLEREFGPEWAERLDRIASARLRWRAEGADMSLVARRTNEMIEKEDWL